VGDAENVEAPQSFTNTGRRESETRYASPKNSDEASLSLGSWRRYGRPL
jgi:hypothetical protein